MRWRFGHYQWIAIGGHGWYGRPALFNECGFQRYYYKPCDSADNGSDETQRYNFSLLSLWSLLDSVLFLRHNGYHCFHGHSSESSHYLYQYCW
jgi:hypothetical protein